MVISHSFLGLGHLLAKVVVMALGGILRIINILLFSVKLRIALSVLVLGFAIAQTPEVTIVLSMYLLLCLPSSMVMPMDCRSLN